MVYAFAAAIFQAAVTAAHTILDANVQVAHWVDPDGDAMVLHPTVVDGRARREAGGKTAQFAPAEFSPEAMVGGELVVEGHGCWMLDGPACRQAGAGPACRQAGAGVSCGGLDQALGIEQGLANVAECEAGDAADVGIVRDVAS